MFFFVLEGVFDFSFLYALYGGFRFVCFACGGERLGFYACVLVRFGRFSGVLGFGFRSFCKIESLFFVDKWLNLNV